jgi:hypothetical protein
MLSFQKYISEWLELDEGKGKPGLWANIHAKRKRGERPAKPGEEGYPKTLDIEEAMSPQQNMDFDKMMKGAMSRSDYNAKWKKPLKSDAKVIYGKNVKESAKGYQPGWMLKKDPELAKKLKAKIDLAKKRQASYGDQAAGKSVKEEVEQLDEVKIGDVLIAGGKNITAGIVTKIEGDSVIVHHRPSNTLHRVSKKSISPSNIVKEELELDEAVDPSEIAGNPKAYSVDTVKKAYYHKKASTSDKESLAHHLDRYHGHKEWRKPLVKEEAEQIDELSKKTLKSYAKKAGAEATGVKGKHLSPEKSNKRFDGFAKAASRLAKEDVEQIDELSKETLGSYKHKAELSIPKDDREYTNRSKGIEKAEKKLKKESVEQLDELSPNLLHRYVKKATGNMGMHAVDHGKYGDQQKDKKSLNKAIKRSSGIASASGRMADKANRNEELTPAAKAEFLAAANKKASLEYWKRHAELKKNDPRVSKKPKNESVDLDESQINDITAQYINENNITLEQLENMTEAELNELIGKAIGGAFKLGAKAAVGATRLAGKAINRMTVSGRADAAEKKAAAVEKKNADRERIRAAQDRLRKAKEAASKR